MMDYVELIKMIKINYKAEDKAVMVFGGSYGGMLAAWLRMKFPHVFQGALAASAPILQFQNGANPNAFGNVCNADFAGVFPEDQRCSKGIRESFDLLMDLKTRPDDWAQVSEVLNTCTVIANETEFQNLYQHYQNGFLYMAMTDYPYPAAFLEPMPAYPVNVSCQAFADIVPPTETKTKNLGALSDRELEVLTALNTSSNVYFNFNGQMACTDTTDTEGTGTLDAAGWNVLACNELAMPIGFDNNTMFIPETFDYENYTAECVKNYGLTPKYEWALQEFGGYNYKKDFKSMSNIIFSNGDLDPWMAGGVTEYVSIQLPVYVIKGGAHHLDMRLPMEEDKGTDVDFVRQKESDLLESWIREYQNMPMMEAETETFLQ